MASFYILSMFFLLFAKSLVPGDSAGDGLAQPYSSHYQGLKKGASRERGVQFQPTVVKNRGIINVRVASEIVAKDKMSLGERGFCWSRREEPTLQDDYMVAGKGSGPFEARIKGLKKATVYHLRPFVMADSVPVYGDETAFTTHTFLSGAKIQLKYVRGGTFQMGCQIEQFKGYGDEFPVHKVRLDGFQISVHEITCSQYSAFLNSKRVSPEGKMGEVMYLDVQDGDCPIRYSGGQFVPEKNKGDHPVTEVTWFGAQAFCEWLGGRLPTEAEWEYAARGGRQREKSKYSGSSNLRQVAWYQDNAGGTCHQVGEKEPNELGLYDMSGNAWEWCHDWYDMNYYAQCPCENPMGPHSGDTRIVRGGAWNMDAWNCRVSNRSSKSPGITYNYYGFRLLIPVDK